MMCTVTFLMTRQLFLAMTLVTVVNILKRGGTSVTRIIIVQLNTTTELSYCIQYGVDYILNG